VKYTVLINLAGIDSAGLTKKTDLNDWLIIDYISAWQLSPRATRLNDHVWINYKTLLKEIPIIGIKKAALSGRVKKLIALNLLSVTYDDDKRLYAKITGKCLSITGFSTENNGVVEGGGGQQDEQGGQQDEHGVVSEMNIHTTTTNSTITNPKKAAAPKPKNLAWKQLNYSSWPALPNDDQMAAIMQNRKSKRGAMTQRAMDLIGNQLQEAVKTGLTPKNCFDEWELRGWVAFKASWMDGATQSRKPSNFTGLGDVVHNEFDQTPRPGDVF